MSADVDSLPPTQYLVMEVLAARARTGDDLWPFPSNLSLALRALEDAGLISVMHGNVPGSMRARLTEAGREHSLRPDYVPPALRRVTAELEAERDKRSADVASWQRACNIAADAERERDEARTEAARLGHSLIKAGHATGAAMAAAAQARTDADAARDELAAAYALVEQIPGRSPLDVLREVITRGEDARIEVERWRRTGRDVIAQSGWIVARDGGRDCLDCDREIRRGEAYELLPGVDNLRHIHCPTSAGRQPTEGNPMPEIFGADLSFSADMKGRHASVQVGGHDITNEIRSFTVDATAGVFPRVTLELAVFDATRIESANTEVAMSSATRDLLIAAGWRPPTEAEEPPAVQHGESGEPWWNAAADQYEVACLCGETFSGDRAGHAGEKLLVHLGRETASDV